MPCPALPIPAGGLALNKDQIRETLNYFREYSFVVFLLFIYLTFVTTTIEELRLRK